MCHSLRLFVQPVLLAGVSTVPKSKVTVALHAATVRQFFAYTKTLSMPRTRSCSIAGRRTRWVL